MEPERLHFAIRQEGFLQATVLEFALEVNKMKKVITCLEPLHGRGEKCGDMFRGDDDDDLVARLQQHLKDVHGGTEMSREQILMLAKPDEPEGWPTRVT